MGYNILPNLEYCKEIVDGYASFLYYTHIPPTIMALLLGIYVLVKNRKSTSAQLLFALSIVFALWTTTDLLIWLTFDQATPMMFLWSLIGILSSLMFALTFFFTFSFVTGRRIPVWLVAAWGVLLLPVIIGAPTSLNLQGFDIRDCVAVEAAGFLYYYHGLGLLTAVLIPFLPLLRRKQEEAKSIPRAAVTFATLGAELFLLTFLGTSFLASYLVETGVVPDFGLEQYGILAMAVFMAFLAYLIVQYNAFNLKFLGAQALVIALVILVASQYLFEQSATNYWLVTLTLVLTIFFGFILVRSVQREIKQREHIEKLAKNLESANNQQVILIHFITHQIKGFVAKSRNIFATALEGDFGTIPDTLRPLFEEGLASDTRGVATIQEILNAANIKNGKVTYAKEQIDLKTLVDEVANDQRRTAEKKGLKLVIETGSEPVMLLGDRTQLVNAIKNLIDNSVKYTPSGEVHIELVQTRDKIRFSVKDTGIGITPEDMSHLFTEGGHGAESMKINVESTGFGLYIVKNIIEAHGGKVWAESEGVGKGSRFVVELPAS
ncbi:MAG: two-component system, NarL family, sensor histidine kinase BarA [Parcubacteria bacterium C7867-004]|nr:MAG: two-component system, NarL family, sensor histidine kinase BarA [Parcubacteria bacterium C7867-004]